MSPVFDAETTERGDSTEHEESGDAPLRVALVFFHPSGAHTAELRPEHPVTIGRSAPCTVVIPDASLSRRHAQFTLEGEDVWVEDLGSTNGTKVNGRTVQRSKVQPRDEIGLGSATALIHELGTRDEDGDDGILTHDAFSVLLEDEVVRAKTFGRPLALMLVARAQGSRGGLTIFHPRIREHLRPVDRAGMYSSDMLEISLPETSRERALEIANAIVLPRSGNEGLLRASIAVFGEPASSADEMIEVCLSSLRRTTANEPVKLAAPIPEARRSPVHAVVVANAKMREIYATVDRLARGRIPVLILGETGTGKEVVAQAIHERGPRASGPMRSVNCGAIPVTLVESVLFGHERGAFTGADQRSLGVFEEASGGTVFLDEVGELPLNAQTALLRVLETHKISRVGSNRELEVDVRVIAATNRDLEAMSREGKFRSELLYRLNAMILELPPLRRRADEIEPLARAFLEDANRANGTELEGFEPEALEQLRRHRWPGNVRELRNVVERAVVIASGRRVRAGDLPDRVRGVAPSRSASISAMRSATGAAPGVSAAGVSAPGVSSLGPEVDLKSAMRDFERKLVEDALRKSGGNQSEAARRLKIPVRTLTHKMKALGIG